jgi:hypothetical protein
MKRDVIQTGLDGGLDHAIGQGKRRLASYLDRRPGSLGHTLTDDPNHGPVTSYS